LSFNADIIKTLLSKYVIDKTKPEWKIKKLCWDGIEREIPDSLNGEILLEEHIEDGKVKGWITIDPNDLANILNMRDNPSLRPNITIPDGKYKGRNLQTLTKDEFEDITGHKKYLDKWRKEGINI
jgi:hypothetical protein